MPTINSKVSDLKGIGPIIDIHISPSDVAVEAIKKSGQDPPTPVLISALIDTGASGSVIKSGIADSLGLSPIRFQDVDTPTSQGYSCPVYFVRLSFSSLGFYFEGAVLETPLIGGQSIDCLIGRDILAAGLLVYNGTDNSFSFSL